MSSIAIVGMACRYPDASSPHQLWENAVAGRRAFRRMPEERLPAADYWDADPAAPDRAYASKAAVIEGYEFDRLHYRIAGRTYRSTDLTHWLALDVAAQALADAGFPDGGGLPRERTSVIVGNSLTGEFTRANVLRLRWPYVRRTITAALLREEWGEDRIEEFLGRLEGDYKSPFPPIDEDTLAGGLSNTIAGRICNYFDLRGGGYTVDGACSSSLLSVATACSALADGDVEVSVAGGVDLSIDPFELVGFAKTGALATGEMRVYDRRSNGFWPGEGCGMLVLMREQDARAAGRRVYATIRGWGVSSDGSGGITRPGVDGYRLALDRAYGRAGFGLDTVPLFEGHGTGTQVGDATELRALAAARRAADPHAAPAAISSIKSGIGHTKAAAGVAGLIKATMAVHEEVLPPAVGCREPHPIFAEDGPALRVLRTAEAWPAEAPVRAGVTAMGFGGINTHVVIANEAPTHRPLPSRTRTLSASAQDAELLLVAADSQRELADRVAELADAVALLSIAQLGDLAVRLARDEAHGRYRVAVVVGDPEDAQRRLTELRTVLDQPLPRFSAGRTGFAGQVSGPGRIGYLFPGQGTGRSGDAPALRRRLTEVAGLYAELGGPAAGDPQDTRVAQPRIVTAAAAGLRALAALGIEADLAVGHSLGEIAALHWAGVLDEHELVRTATARGEIFAAHSVSGGAMVGVASSAAVATDLAEGLALVVSGYNGPQQVVLAGPGEDVDEFCRRTQEARVATTRLGVTQAFHSPLVAPVAVPFRAWLDGRALAPVRRRVVSTVTGAALSDTTDVAELLERQVEAPVLFEQAIDLAAKEVDLFVEVGAGRVLTRMVTAWSDAAPVLPLDVGADSLRPLLEVAAAAYVLGTDAPARLFEDRLTRPVRIGGRPKVFVNPCETVDLPDIRRTAPVAAAPAPESPALGDGDEDGLELLRRLVAERAELPPELVADDSRLLDDLHLSSITVGTIYTEIARHLGVPAAQAPANLATASLRELAASLDTAVSSGTGDAAPPVDVAGAAAWVRAFRVDLDPEPLPPAGEPGAPGTWTVFAPDGHALARPLSARLEEAGVGGGVLLCLPPDCQLDDLGRALQGAQAAAGAEPGTRVLLVQSGRGAAGLTKALRQEAPQLHVTVVHLPLPPWDVRQVVDAVVAEVAATYGFSEVHLDDAGGRRVPVLRAMPVRPRPSTVPPLGSGDVLLVTGGGKGITAECALALATDSGARLGLLGRSDPAQDADLAANLRRIKDSGIAVAYARADVADPVAVRMAVQALTVELGPITAVLHGAGRNVPTRLAELDLAALRSTVAPKVDGLQAVLAAVDQDRLRLLVTFGSIIGRAGLRGEAHYAVANEWLAELTQEFAVRHPECRTLCLEWSVWSGIGMGERLAVSGALAREGITAITPDQGLAMLRRLVADPDAPAAVVVSGRTGAIDTVRREDPELPVLRFVGRPLVRYHGVELVSEVELNPGTDLYLGDHELDGDLLFPAVFGLEAMAQVAHAATGSDGVPRIHDLELLRPITVRPDGTTTIRIAATVTDDDRTVAVAVRSAETGFAADHFRAVLLYARNGIPPGPPSQADDDLPPVALDPARDLYGGLLFQGARFRRLRRYRRVAARAVDAEVAVRTDASWFAPFLPARLLLGDPGARDAFLHGNQVCVPDATLLPSGVDHLYLADLAGRTVRYCATERRRDGDTYVYDVAARDETGRVVERWDGLRLRAVRKRGGRGPWPAVLVGPYLERELEDRLGVRTAVVVEPDDDTAVPGEPGHVSARRARTATAARRAHGRRLSIGYRPDGRPDDVGAHRLSASHAAGFTLCVLSEREVACDVEAVTARSAEAWAALLGRHAATAALSSAETEEHLDTAATRLWAVSECLRKAGQPDDAPVTPVAAAGEWQTFASGSLRIATLATHVSGVVGPVVFAVLAGGPR